MLFVVKEKQNTSTFGVNAISKYKQYSVSKYGAVMDYVLLTEP